MGLPASRRLRRSSDVTAAVRRGRRARSGGLVAHVLPREPTSGAAGPRVAFVAPRTVGGAVVRNRVRRRLQAAVLDLTSSGALDRDVDLVLRLLPASATAPSEELRRDLRRALGRSGVLDGGR